jgi:hypothetical protein
MAFPASPHDDLTDSLTQALNFLRQARTANFAQAFQVRPADPATNSVLRAYERNAARGSCRICQHAIHGMKLRQEHDGSVVHETCLEESKLPPASLDMRRLTGKPSGKRTMLFPDHVKLR